VTSKDPAQHLPTSVQKSYFMLSRSARAVLDTALQKYRPGRSDLIPVGGIAQLKPALRLMTAYRLMVQEVTGAEVLTSYTRWLECVQVKEGPEPKVYVAFSHRFERIWLESRKRLPEYMEQKPANTGLRSQYSLRLYSWAKGHVEAGAQTISLEELRRVFGLESIKEHGTELALHKLDRMRQRTFYGPRNFRNRDTAARQGRDCTPDSNNVAAKIKAHVRSSWTVRFRRF
jgi:hypothetical protein